ncbi:MAG: heavy metal-binding domain-containing protein [Candidatus Omnitrophota bacterium]
MRELFDLIYFCILVFVGYTVGTMVEKENYRSIRERESASLDLPVVAGEDFQDESIAVERSEMVYGNIVIGTDYFRLIVAGLRNLLGGEVSAYETLVDRGRREAVLRMKERAAGADIILNLRIETCQITQTGTVEVLAYGTALYYKK